jgi:hypothetical protein
LTAGFGLDDSSRIDTLGGGKQMPLTGKDVWEAIVGLGLASGPYDPKTNRHCVNAERIAGLLNEVLRKQESAWLPNLIQTEDAMRAWLDNTPREHVLRLYKYLNATGITMTGIDAAIERETKLRRGLPFADPTTKKARP